ncbi:MAG TPA: CHRD domain-containing protein [Burkholderiales bacterium]|nr:CHRD domain-containing protein [Burkholderiales bacterium]
MKVTGIFRRAVPAVMAAAALAIAGCGTMSMFKSGSKVTLSGVAQNPPVTTSASGSGTITVKDDQSVSGSVTTSGLAGTAAHIHVGARGENGPVAVPLAKSADGNTWSVPDGAKLTDAQYAAYKAGNLYVNVHTVANKGGEIRGQINP